MLADDNSSIVRRVVTEILGARSDLRVSSDAPSDRAHRAEADTKDLQRALRLLRQPFPDLQLTVVDSVPDGDNLTVETEVRGTHTRTFEGIPPTGTQLSLTLRLVMSLERDRRIARFKVDHDELWNRLFDLIYDAHEAAVPWYKRYAGGDWERRGRQQLEFLVGQGLRPHHQLLDMGCGTLRGGVRLIDYLEPGHYAGIDSQAEALEGAEAALREVGLKARNPTLVRMDDFDLTSLGRDFDYIFAYSVFTELPLNAIIRCLMNVHSVLLPGARFYATFWDHPEGKFNLEPVERSKDLYSYFDSYPYHYDVGTFEWICEGTELQVQSLGAWAGVGPESTLLFTRR